MENRPKRAWWERIQDEVRNLLPQGGRDRLPEPTPEIQALAAKIMEVLATDRNARQRSAEQTAKRQRIQAPYVLMLDRFVVDKVYWRWARNPADPEARQAWYSLLLGILIRDRQLQNQFRAALSEPAVRLQEEKQPGIQAVESSAATQQDPLSPASEPIPLDEPLPAPPQVEQIPAEAAEPPEQPEENPEIPQPAPTPAGSPEVETLVELLRSDKELQKIVYAMHYSNHALLDLANELADEPGLSELLYDFFKKSDFGKKLVGE